MYSRVISIKLNGKDIKCIIYYKKIRTLSLRIKNNENIIYSPMRLSVKYIKNFILKSLPRLIERHKKINAIKKINLEKNIIFVMGEKYLIQKDEKINDDF
jgi:predicted metal-dependent hydrolase